jgi:hypothetical protein
LCGEGGVVSGRGPGPSPDPEPYPDDDELAALRAEIDEVERNVIRRLEPGGWAMVIAIAAFVVLAAQLLPWVGSSAGWQVLLGQTDPAHRVGPLPRLFAASSLLFGVVASALTLVTRRWWLAWLCAVGCAFSVVHGLWAVWSRQTSGTVGPGIGLILAALAVVVLAARWLRVALSRP